MVTRRRQRGRGRRTAILAGVLAIALAMAIFITAEISPRVAPPIPPPPPGAVLWSADTETGDLSQWQQGQEGEAVFNTGTGNVAVTTADAHSGKYALAMSIRGADGPTQAARILRWHNTPVEGYYSVWLDFPQVYRPNAWWNVLQFKSQRGEENDPIFVLNVGNRQDGTMYFYLWESLTNESYSEINRIDIRPGKWTQITAYLRRATDHTGRITIWEDGVLLFDVDQVQTAIGDNTHFGIGNYTDGLSPPDAVIYADDAEIRSVIRLNPSAAAAKTP